MRSVLALVVLVSAAVAVVTAGEAIAAPRKVLVFPLDGAIDPAARAKLNLSIQKVARTIPDASITVGDTTFDETAAAIGCEPTQPACAEIVRSTLGVDELVYGRATVVDGETTVTVKRTRAKTPTREQTTTIAESDPPDRAETELQPFFDGKPVAPKSVDPIGTPLEPVVPEAPHDNSQRNKGILLVTTGGVAMIFGFALWANVSGIQEEIDRAPTNNAADFAALEELESAAFQYALAGDILVVAGVLVAGYGGWVLYSDRKQPTIAVTPTITPTTAGIAIGGVW